MEYIVVGVLLALASLALAIGYGRLLRDVGVRQRLEAVEGRMDAWRAEMAKLADQAEELLEDSRRVRARVSAARSNEARGAAAAEAAPLADPRAERERQLALVRQRYGQ